VLSCSCRLWSKSYVESILAALCPSQVTSLRQITICPTTIHCRNPLLVARNQNEKQVLSPPMMYWGELLLLVWSLVDVGMNEKMFVEKKSLNWFVSWSENKWSKKNISLHSNTHTIDYETQKKATSSPIHKLLGWIGLCTRWERGQAKTSTSIRLGVKGTTTVLVGHNNQPETKLELCPFPSRPNLRDLRNAQSHIPGSRDKPGNGYRM
jgi:hypothetical protein